MRLPEPPLLLVTDRSQARRTLIDITEAACSAGCRWISVREKDLPSEAQVALARTLLPIVRRHGARLMLHGDPELAREAGLDGVHLSAGSDSAAARAIVGADALIGVSVHGAAEFAHIAGADYVVAGPAYETASKPGYGPALGPERLAAIARVGSVPVIAIGGINPVNAPRVLAAGTTGIAVMGSVMRAADPGKEVRALIAAMATARAR